MRDVEGEIDVLIDGALHVADDLVDLIGFGPQHVEIIAVHTHDNGLLGAGEDLLDPLVQVHLDVAVQAGNAVDRNERTDLTR